MKERAIAAMKELLEKCLTKLKSVSGSNPRDAVVLLASALMIDP